MYAKCFGHSRAADQCYFLCISVPAFPATIRLLPLMPSTIPTHADQRKYAGGEKIVVQLVQNMVAVSCPCELLCTAVDMEVSV